ncbi:MAG: DUF1566 domain-containing protein [Gammaproteobacteria bacterium]
MRNLLGLALLIFSTASHAALIGRAPTTPGGTDYQAYYDDVLNITWLADANYAETSGFDADGRMNWEDSLAFVGTLNSDVLLGVTGWRLPNMTDVDNDGCVDEQSTSGGDCGYNIDTENGEMASMFYDTLGNLAFFFPDGTAPQPGWGLSNTGPFTNLDGSVLYWYGNEDVSNIAEAWYFGMPSGAQRPREKFELHKAWAVVDGDALAPIPVPAAAWLFGSALVLLGRMRRKAA